MKTICLIGVISFCLQSCYVVGIYNKPTWKSNEINKIDNDTHIEVKLSKPNILIPSLFCFLAFDKKQYILTIYLFNKSNDSNFRIENINYKIFDSLYNPVLVKPIVRYGDNYSYTLDTVQSYYSAWAETDPIIKVPKTMFNGNLIIEYEILFKNQKNTIKGTKTLYITKYNWIWLDSFF
jgi:hypothetical protein